jgi:uncharacterized membrane protein
MASSNGSETELSPERILMLTDGIFAIAMTILVLELHVPELAEHLSDADLHTALFALLPKFLSYVVSFAILGIYWVGHHNVFHFIKRVDRRFLWLNILFLLLIALIPFSAALLGNYGNSQISVIVYGTHLILLGIVLFVSWRYAARKKNLTNGTLSEEFIQTVERYILKGPAAYAIAIGVSFFSIPASILIYTLLPVYYILQTRLDTQVHQELKKQKNG